MITNTHTFSENTFFILKVMAVICAAIFGFYALYIVINGLPLFTPEYNLSAEGFPLAVILGVGLFSVLVTFLALSVTPKRIITCNAEGCEILMTDFWNASRGFDSFRWNEVTDTNLIEAETDAGIGDGGIVTAYFFVIEVGEQKKWLLNHKRSSKKTISELIELINEATPQLKYVWEKTADFSDRQLIVEVQKYSKVVRT
jgi:hypothetical protein